MTADIVSLTEFKKNPGRTIKHAADSRRPVLLTSHGRGVAVVEAIADYERKEEERAFIRAIVARLTDLEAAREVPVPSEFLVCAEDRFDSKPLPTTRQLLR